MTWADAIAAIEAGANVAAMPPEGYSAGRGATGAIERHMTRCGCGRLAKLDAHGRCFGCALADEDRCRRFSLKPHQAWMADESGCAMEARRDAEAERVALCRRAGVQT